MPDRNQEIIDSLRRTYEAFSRGDFDAAMEIAHPEIEFIPPAGQGSYEGVEAIRAWAEPDAFDEQVVQPREFRVNGDKVLVKQLARARGAGSGIELEVENWAVWTLDEESRATRLESFATEAEALEAAGLSS